MPPAVPPHASVGAPAVWMSHVAPLGSDGPGPRATGALRRDRSCL